MKDPREYIVQSLMAAGPYYRDGAESILAEYDAAHRAEIAAEVHRADLPQFAAGEAPELVARTVRAVDGRLVLRGAEAPYAAGPVVEFAVALSSESYHLIPVRDEGLAFRSWAEALAFDPAARLVTRTCGPWREVSS